MELEIPLRPASDLTLMSLIIGAFFKKKIQVERIFFFCIVIIYLCTLLMTVISLCLTRGHAGICPISRTGSASIPQVVVRIK